MIFPELNESNVSKACGNAGIKSERHAAEIIKQMIELRSNNEIMEFMKLNYAKDWKYSTFKRKFNALLQSFIISNYFDDFLMFCRINGITIFNDDLEVRKEDATYARIIYIVFLRENLMMKKTMEVRMPI